MVNEFAFEGSKTDFSPVLVVLSAGNISLDVLDLLLRTPDLDRDNDGAVSEGVFSPRGRLSGYICIGGSGVEFLTLMTAKSHSSSNFWQLVQTG